MTPRKARHTQNQLSVNQPSDYESDANYLSDIPPPPPTRTDDELNLLVMKRHNPAVISLEYIAPYAVVYIFSTEIQQWEKNGIEGTAFLCRLAANEHRSERYSVTVLNRRGLNNFQVELLSSADVEVTPEFIILQSEMDGVPLVYGLWIFTEPPPSSTAHHKDTIAQKIESCAERAEESLIRAADYEDDGYEDEVEDEISVPMGRQLSLKELFGQQRQQDDAWSVRSHSPQRKTAPFAPSTDTDFFRAPKRHMTPHSPAVSAQSDGQGRDVLLDMFRKAGAGLH